jgi:hypothetical protein
MNVKKLADLKRLPAMQAWADQGLAEAARKHGVNTQPVPQPAPAVERNER